MMTNAEVAQILLLVQERMRFKPGVSKEPITPVTVAVWKSDFDAANCHHYHLMERAVSDFFATPDAQYGATAAGIIAAYKRLTRRIAERTPRWSEMDYDHRQAVLAHSPPDGPQERAALTGRTLADVEAGTGVPADLIGRLREAVPDSHLRSAARRAEAEAELDAMRGRQ